MVAGLIVWPFLWANRVLAVGNVWAAGLVLCGLLAAVPPQLWQQQKRFSPAIIRILAFVLVGGLFFLGGGGAIAAHSVIAVVYWVVWLVLLGLCFVFGRPGAGANLALAGMGIVFAIVVANFSAGILLQGIENQQTAAAPPTPTQAATAEPTTAVTTEPTPTSPPAPTATPSLTIDPNATSVATATPEPTRPIAGFGYLDWEVDNGEAEWTNLTAYGPRVNSVAHAYMYDVNGNIVYDNIIEYNGKGYRGPEVPYEKPDDVYRILIMGDSFVEAIQVPYEQTFQAQLQERLSEHDTADRRYEVVAMGRTGWGTVHETVYYQVEGYKYNADLVILMFYINDVADNFPRFFYPNVNNTNFDFVFGQDSIQILDTNEEPLPPNRPRLLYNALPEFLKQSKLARLFIRMADPPIPVQTPGGVMTRVHPQFYIYVSDPPVEGYDDGWDKTADALDILANSVEENGGQLAVVPIFLGQDMVTSVSNWFPAMTEGWQWDAGLPDQMLAQIFEGSDVMLWPTRPYFEAYADEVGGEVYNLLYLPEDGHFNALGHEATYEAVYGWLVEAGVVIE
jgi:lysophospholipase L1-like esterase